LFAKLGLLQAGPDALKAWGNPELALVYLSVMLGVALLGPGRFALDATMGGGARK
jgi:hypothetical protein